MALTLKGEAGKALDAAVRTPSLLKIRDLELRSEAMADDSLTWTARTPDLAGRMTILPQFEQAVSLYQDGQRIFHGHVSDPKSLLRGTRVTVLGPWWWLKREQLTQVTGGTDRPTMEFPQQTVKASIVQLLTRAIAKGVPIRIGTIAETPLVLSKMQYSEATYADILAELLKLLPDAVGWWDYSGNGLPSFNVTRRAEMAAVSYDLSELVEPYDLTPAGEMVAERVELTYYTRSATGLPVPQVQGYGTAAPGKTQVIAWSGPERAAFVPKDDLESFAVQTTNANVTINTLRPFLLDMLQEVVASRAATGKPTATDVTLANAEVLESESNKDPADSGNTYFHPQPALTLVDSETGAVVSRVGKHLVLTQDVPEWLSLPGMQRVKITGRIYVLVAQLSSKSPYGSGDNIFSTPPPAWAAAFPWSAKLYMSRTGEPPVSNWMSQTSFAQPSGYNRHQNQLWALDFEIEGAVSTTGYPVATTFYKPAEFDYLVPPANTARALYDMQRWTPYRGTLTRKLKSVPDGVQLLNRKFNVGGAAAELATMGALAKAITHSWRGKTVTRSIELGPPARYDTRSLAQRFRLPTQTNIQYTT